MNEICGGLQQEEETFGFILQAKVVITFSGPSVVVEMMACVQCGVRSHLNTCGLRGEAHLDLVLFA